MAHQEDQALLKAYIAAWSKFFVQCSYLPLPFTLLDSNIMNKSSSTGHKKSSNDESVVRKVTNFINKSLSPDNNSRL